MSFRQVSEIRNQKSVAIKTEGLAKTYFLYDSPADRLKQFVFRWKPWFRPFAALKPATLEIRKGETVGIVGRNGSGKSTLLQLICGTLTPTAGKITVNGRVSALLELGSGFNPEFTGRENIFLNGQILGMSRREVEKKYDAIIAFSGIDAAHIGQPVRTYSSGMVVRLAFAVAVATDPDILIVDEALAVGDIAFQRKCFARIQEMQKKGATILFVSHAVQTVQELCHRVLLMDEGEILMDGASKPVLAQYGRLMFAPEEKRDEIRKELPVAGCRLPEAFDEGMEPESTVEYEKRGAEIKNPRLTTLRGKKVNVLKRGQRYVYTYDVRFSEAAKGVRFGMNIKTKSGVVLGGATTHTEKEAENRMRGGGCRVRFTFRCLLLPGTYFTNAGCSGIINGERVMLHRILDACMFRVAEEPALKATGTVDFEVQSEVSNR